MDSQPEDARSIVQIDAPYEGHYSMGMRDYYQMCTWEDMLRYCKIEEIPNPDFWGCYAEEFPFPDRKDIFYRCDECKKWPLLPKMKIT